MQLVSHYSCVFPGYTYIVDNIRGYRFINHSYQKQYLNTLIPNIGKMITPCELLPHLLAKDLIGSNDQENIQREHTNHGNFAANVMLLDRITRKHRNWYILFIEALNEANMEEVAANLQIPELLENKREKVTDACKSMDTFKQLKHVDNFISETGRSCQSNCCSQLTVMLVCMRLNFLQLCCVAFTCGI